MLTKIEERILKYLVENYPEQEIPKFKDVDLQEVYDALDSLERKRYIVNLSSLSTPSARLTNDGKFYFEILEKNK